MDEASRTPKQHVFDSLRNLLKMVETEDLNARRAILHRSISNVLSWESELENREVQTKS